MTQATESSPLLPSEPVLERHSPLYDDDDDDEAKRLADDDAADYDTLIDAHAHADDHADVLRDVIIGFSDGLTVPFALTAGLSGLGSSRLVVAGGLAELFSGMISMGLGAYLAAATERDRRAAQRRPPPPSDSDSDVFALLRHRYDVPAALARPLAAALAASPDQRARFPFPHTATTSSRTPPRRHAACLSGLAMGLSYLVGGLVPMLPYLVVARVGRALVLSAALAALALLLFGYAKSYYAAGAGAGAGAGHGSSSNRHRAGLRGALQTLAVGALAAGASFVIVKALDS